MSRLPEPRIAVLVPCYNEAASIGSVVQDFARVLPGAAIYVYDNNSSDSTAAVARDAGAVVRRETLQGKGNVVRRMFGDVEADVYVLVDGDDTYDAASAPRLIEELTRGGFDMVVGARVADAKAAYRKGHRLGNVMLTGLVGMLFGNRFRDMLSGYRFLSRRFVKSFPALSAGFEVETELNVHALELRMNILEVDTPYRARPEGSFSKLSTFRDGMRILRMIAKLVKEERPFQFFGAISIGLALTSVLLAVPIVTEFLETGLVPRFPTAILASAIMTVAVLAFFAGLILDTVTHGRREMKRLAYLRYAGPGWAPAYLPEPEDPS